MDRISIYCNSFNSDPWNDFPTELKRLYHESFLNCDDERCRYLIGRLNYYVFRNKNMVSAIKWIDRFFGDLIMTSGEFLYHVWNDNADDLIHLLDKERELLDIVVNQRITYKSKTPGICSDYAQIVQNLNMYYAVVGLCSGREKLYKKYMHEVLRYTKYNLAYMISANGIVPESYKELDDNDIYYREYDYWEEPMAWIVHFAMHNGYSAMILEFQEQYVNLLERMYMSTYNSHIEDFLYKAYLRTCKMCDDAITFFMEEESERLELFIIQDTIDLEIDAEMISEKMDMYKEKLLELVSNNKRLKGEM